MTNNPDDSSPDPRIAGWFALPADGSVYANHAAMSPWPLPTAQAVAAFALDNAARGPAAYADWLKIETALRARVARLLNAADDEDIALLANTSAGVNIVANGLNWRRGDNLVTCVGEFPTKSLAWEQLSAQGVELRAVDIRATPDPEAALAAQMDARTRLLAISSVQWSDGFRLDLECLGAACADAGAWFFVDAIQQFGALPVDVSAARIHALAAGSHKWQMGPEGMGVFYCHPGLREELRLRQFGWHMLNDPYRFDRPDSGFAHGARRFEPGSPNTVGQLALNTSLEVLEQVGVAEVGRRVLANTARLVSAIDALAPLELVSAEAEQRRSGIVALRHRELDIQGFHRALKQRKVIAVVREGAVRLSPHFYQRGAVMDHLLNALEDTA
jgi:selenocysteine lyase/cysteine desulfurase